MRAFALFGELLRESNLAFGKRPNEGRAAQFKSEIRNTGPRLRIAQGWNRILALCYFGQQRDSSIDLRTAKDKFELTL